MARECRVGRPTALDLVLRTERIPTRVDRRAGIVVSELGWRPAEPLGGRRWRARVDLRARQGSPRVKREPGRQGPFLAAPFCLVLLLENIVGQVAPKRGQIEWRQPRRGLGPATGPGRGIVLGARLHPPAWRAGRRGEDAAGTPFRRCVLQWCEWRGVDHTGVGPLGLRTARGRGGRRMLWVRMIPVVRRQERVDQVERW